MNPTPAGHALRSPAARGLCGPRRNSRLRTAFLLTTIAATGLAGCQHPHYARQNEKFRLESLEWTAQTLARHETQRPRQLEIAAHHVDRRLYYNARQMRFNLEAAERLAERDVLRFQNRPPAYGDKAARLFWARPETIEWTAITLFW